MIVRSLESPEEFKKVLDNSRALLMSSYPFADALLNGTFESFKLSTGAYLKMHAVVAFDNLPPEPVTQKSHHMGYVFYVEADTPKQITDLGLTEDATPLPPPTKLYKGPRRI